jgi:hypothetical protein
MKKFFRKAPVLFVNLLVAAAAFAAILSGVVPGWSFFRIVPADLQSGAGSSTPFSQSETSFAEPSEEPPGTASAAQAGLGEPESSSVRPESVPPQTSGSSADSAVPSADSSAAVSFDYFSDALFIGDSVTEGQKLYGDLDSASYFCRVGLTIYQLFEDPKSDRETGLTLEETLKKRRYGKIFILLGLNELGTGKTEYFVEHYSAAVTEILRLQPDTKIFVEAILPVSKEKSDGDDVFSNSHIRERNAGLRELAKQNGWCYFDLLPAVGDGEGSLRAEYTGDGVHIKAKYWDSICDYIRTGAPALAGN